jgi:hypothetical protein
MLARSANSIASGGRAQRASAALVRNSPDIFPSKERNRQAARRVSPTTGSSKYVSPLPLGDATLVTTQKNVFQKSGNA